MGASSIATARHRRIFISRFSATSNESLSDTSTLDAPLKEFFPALTNKTLAEYANVYPVSEFGDEVTRNTYATGESELRCAVRMSFVLRSPL